MTTRNPLKNDAQQSRRKFFTALGTGALAAASTGAVVLSAEFLTPNALFEPPSRVLVGKPDQYPPGSVAYLTEHQVVVVREGAGYFYALSAVCTHLGCIINWKSQEGVFRCPCHGSIFDKVGEVLGGPAPRPLRHLALSLTPNGYLQVDKSIEVEPSEILKV
ncbi:MAG: hypothetical protein A3F83_10610 [Candidatus Glassbacteria bacterium RIFCSPLOWO2_12_FULL_58_11]|uniref:Rieske domain-containing protein n=1 Tax=Candidatus Glassbacteria bacterium RIFCSPLOWO2_12_FULL_58_11 TaxID=1817867 RepID=A0A1F5YQI9_9BACT|nr:MAG: hypothetical protein A3F83_10610 [Candidatus Glassbacteria bacterium RIFCSPLOWO2_12_FULL_58_11]